METKNNYTQAKVGNGKFVSNKLQVLQSKLQRYRLTESDPFQALIDETKAYVINGSNVTTLENLYKELYAAVDHGKYFFPRPEKTTVLITNAQDLLKYYEVVEGIKELESIQTITYDKYTLGCLDLDIFYSFSYDDNGIKKDKEYKSAKYI
jgi:hypothetical protein